MVMAALANALWWAGAAPSFAAFNRALRDPHRTQERILRRYVERNADTAFGREHHFADITSPAEFASRVPPRAYDELRPWINRIRAGEERVLTHDPVRTLVPTSGSTAARKLIPYTQELQRELNRAIGPWVFSLFRVHPSAMAGASYWSVSPASDAFEGDATSSVPIGFDDDAEYLGGWRKRLVTAVLAVPGAVARIASIDAWRYATLLLLLRKPGLRLVSVWHPSFLSLLLDAMPALWARLIEDVRTGGCAVAGEVSAQVAPLLTGRALPRRAAALERIGPTDVPSIWPKLAVLSCWADGAASGPAASLVARLPGAAIQPKGLFATEGVVSIPVGARHPLAIRSHYFEFEDDAGAVHGAADLRSGAQYSVLITTAGGLYRYRLHDLVRIDGFAGRTPSIRFVGKTGLISDQRGEKLSDGFVAGVLAEVFAGHLPTFAMLAPAGPGGKDGSDDSTVRYALFSDGDVSDGQLRLLDAALARNPHYAYCRRLGQLAAPVAVRVGRDATARYCERLRALGRRLGDIKPTALNPLAGWKNWFDCGENTTPVAESTGHGKT